MSLYIKHILLPAALSVVLCACQDEVCPPLTERESAVQIKISSEILQEYVSRANDGGFADKDAIGVFIVDYNGVQPGVLQSSNNHANNVKFTFDEESYVWKGSTSIYWSDDKTAIDAYSYYPYRDYVENVNRMPMSVQTRQDKDYGDTSMSGYEASDLLWAKAENVKPGNTINLMHSHRMASVKVSLIKGEGFGEEWNDLEKTILVQNTVAETDVDLSTGNVTVQESEPEAIYPYHKGEDWCCIVAPQTVAAGKALFTITIDGEGYNFKRESALTYQASRLHKFTFRVDKRNVGDYTLSLIDESITPWENDPVSHQMSSRAYTVVDVKTPGSLEETVKNAGITPGNVENLKLTGTMNNADFEYLKYNFCNIFSLNMKELRTIDIPLTDCYTQPLSYGIFDDHRPITEHDKFDDALPFCMALEYNQNDRVLLDKLHHVVLPDHCKYIGLYAFYATPITGVLDLPEGLIWAGDCMLGGYGSYRYHLTRLNLPSTLVYIGGSAFGGPQTTGGTFSNELILPEGLKFIGGGAFMNCTETYGDIHIPSGVEYIGEWAFCNCAITGRAVFPSGTKTINRGVFAGSKITGVYIPEGVEEIAEEAFWATEGGWSAEQSFSSQLQGDIHLPKSLKTLGRRAFSGTKISHVNIPATLETIGQDAFRDCKFLMDTIVIPEGVRRIYGGAFNGCSNLSAIVLPSTMEILGGSLIDWDWGDAVFAGCYSLEYFRCDAVLPPTLIGDSFGDMHMCSDVWGDQVPKDNFTLVVPEQSVETYQNTPYWNEFKRISAYRNLVFRPQNAKVLNKGGERSVILNVDAGKTWTVTECPSWMHISKATGTGKTELKITIDAMSHGSKDRDGEIKVQLNGTDYVTTFHAYQFDYEYDEDQCYTIQSHSQGAGVDIVFVGDGYDAEDISTGVYLDDMKNATEQFFDVEPYKTYRQYFNVYTTFAMSNESGIGSINYLRDCKFDTSYGNGSYDSRISCDFDNVAFYCLDNTPVSEVNFNRLSCIVVANGSSYDGLTTMYSTGTAVALCPKSTASYPNDARGIIQHEGCGHAFGKLADEYRYHISNIQTCPCFCCGHTESLIAMQTLGWGLNLSLSGKTVDVPWQHLLHDQRVNDIVDIWEGGYFHARGVYRSEFNSCMNNNVPYFSTWSRELIVRRIMDYAGVKYDYDTFIANDSREWGSDFTLGARGNEPNMEVVQKATHPIIVNGSPKRSDKNVRR